MKCPKCKVYMPLVDYGKKQCKNCGYVQYYTGIIVNKEWYGGAV